MRIGEALGDCIRFSARERFFLGDQGDPCDGQSFDLGTLLRHELGHILGLHDLRDSSRRGDVMYLGLDPVRGQAARG